MGDELVRRLGELVSRFLGFYSINCGRGIADLTSAPVPTPQSIFQDAADPPRGPVRGEPIGEQLGQAR